MVMKKKRKKAKNYFYVISFIKFCAITLLYLANSCEIILKKPAVVETGFKKVMYFSLNH